MNNKQIAHKYCQMARETLTDDGVWVSDNLGDMVASERRMILKVYKKYYKIVEYTPETGVCKCTNGSTTDMPQSADILMVGDTGGDHGRPLRSENTKPILENAKSVTTAVAINIAGDV